MSYSVGNCVAVTKSDTTDDPAGPFIGLHCNVSGNVVVLFDAAAATAQTLAVSAGLSYPYRIKRVQNTNTTATVLGLKKASGP